MNSLIKEQLQSSYFFVINIGSILAYGLVCCGGLLAQLDRVPTSLVMKSMTYLKSNFLVTEGHITMHRYATPIVYSGCCQAIKKSSFEGCSMQ